MVLEYGSSHRILAHHFFAIKFEKFFLENLQISSSTAALLSANKCQQTNYTVRYGCCSDQRAIGRFITLMVHHLSCVVSLIMSLL